MPELLHAKESGEGEGWNFRTDRFKLPDTAACCDSSVYEAWR